ncbi:MAG: nucleotide exchange factor GrpE [Bacteroidales bacterium]|nr:nucleotide exchange factor GrpE [Bacteroidales bacterium]
MEEEKENQNIENHTTEKIQEEQVAASSEKESVKEAENLSAIDDSDKNSEKDSKKRNFLGRKDKLEKKIEEMQAAILKMTEEKAELQDKYLRLYSEFDNYRKRTTKEKLDVIKNASESLITSVLPIIDDMERAMQYNQKAEAELSVVVEGESLIFQKLMNILKQKGVTLIETENAHFNTDFHEAVSIVPAPSEAEKGKIIDVVEKGYMLNDKVIRFAKVVIYQ